MKKINYWINEDKHSIAIANRYCSKMRKYLIMKKFPALEADILTMLQKTL